MKMIELSIIVVSYNVSELLTACLISIQKTCGIVDYEIIVTDNASSDGSVSTVKKEFPSVRLVENHENLGFARANNQAFEICTGKYVLLLNPDTIVGPGSIKNVLDFMKQTPDCGLAGCRQVGSDGKPQWSIRSFHTLFGNLLWAFGLDRLFRNEHKESTYYRVKPFQIGYPTGAFMMVRREALNGMQLFNENFFMYSEEPDLAMRLKRSGWLSYFVPSAEIIHYEGQSTKNKSEEMFLQLHRSHLLFYKLYYSKPYAIMLQLTWGLVVFNTWAVSVTLASIGRGQERARLFGRALREYPTILKEVWRQ